MTEPARKERPNERARTVALAYLKRGWKPVPIGTGRKSPNDKDWQNTPTTEENLARKFSLGYGNVGVQLGKVSNGLTDVDLDCAEALKLADVFLPETKVLFGRRSKPKSHRLYVTNLADTETVATIQYAEPPGLIRDPKNAMLVELRVGGGGKGAVSMFPGSTHSFDGGLLKKQVATLATAALLVRHYPAKGLRHKAALVLGGVLARLPEADASIIEHLVTAIARAAGDSEAVERGRSAAGAVAKFEAGENLPGIPRMQEVWGEQLTNTVVEWLDIGSTVQRTDKEIAEVDRLAKMDLLEYDRKREAAAEALGGIRVSTLDKVVQQRREWLQMNSMGGGFMQPVEPWAHPVDGAKLLDDICDVLDRHIVLKESAAIATALWVLHAHAFDAFTHSPILDIGSPTKRCGKSNLLDVLSKLVPKPLSAANVTPATLFRAIDRWHPTMLIDEMDTFISDSSELRGVLNSGHKKALAYIVRCVGEELTPKQFSTWSPKVFAHIGRIHPTLEDRSIGISLQRRLTTTSVEEIPNDPDAYSVLRRKCARWADDHKQELEKAKPSLPDINDRAKDNWRPLLAVADICGGDWPEDARDVANELSGVDDDETFGIQLLQDLRKLFEREGGKLATAGIVHALNQMDDRPWPDFDRGQPITAANIAKLLKPFKIRSSQMRVDGINVKGYKVTQFKNVFKRYLSEAQA